MRGLIYEATADTAAGGAHREASGSGGRPKLNMIPVAVLSAIQRRGRRAEARLEANPEGRYGGAGGSRR